MIENQLMEDLEHRRDLAAELARFADGQQGLGLGTALAGLLACLNPLLISLVSGVLLPTFKWRTQGEPFLLICSLLLLLNALMWLLMKGWLQARFYRGHGAAGVFLPHWEIRVGVVLLVGVGLILVWLGTGSMVAANSPGYWEQWHSTIFGIATLKFFAGVSLLTATIVLVVSLVRVRGLRNWIGWLSLCAPFFFFLSLPHLVSSLGQRVRFINALVGMALLGAIFFLPLLALFIGLSDHLRYRRLVKDLGGLPPVEERQ